MWGQRYTARMHQPNKPTKVPSDITTSSLDHPARLASFPSTYIFSSSIYANPSPFRFLGALIYMEKRTVVYERFRAYVWSQAKLIPHASRFRNMITLFPVHSYHRRTPIYELFSRSAFVYRSTACPCVSHPFYHWYESFPVVESIIHECAHLFSQS